jgi:hypothetical protein
MISYEFNVAGVHLTVHSIAYMAMHPSHNQNMR